MAETPQERARRVEMQGMSHELTSVYKKHEGVAGFVLMVSRDSMSWTFVLPKWTGIRTVSDMQYVLHVEGVDEAVGAMQFLECMEQTAHKILGMIKAMRGALNTYCEANGWNIQTQHGTITPLGNAQKTGENN